jgi:hypothetical protein
LYLSTIQSDKTVAVSVLLSIGGGGESGERERSEPASLPLPHSYDRTYHIISPQHTSERLEHSNRQKKWSEAALHEAAKSGFVRN